MGITTAQFDSVRSQRVSIIGAGNTGCALAADLKHRGFSVCLYAHPDHAGRLEQISERGTMVYSGVIEGECVPDLLTTHESDAFSFADNVILALPSYAQDEMFERIAPHIQNQHKIINLNGNFSSYILAKLVEDRSPVIVETNCAPHASRACCNGDVEIPGVKQFLPIASLSANLSDDAKNAIASIIPSRLEWQTDILAVGFQLYNGVLHPPTMVLNAGRIDRDMGSSFRFYAEGVPAHVGKMIEAIDQERLHIAKLYGHDDLRTTLQALNGIYKEDGLESISQFAKCAKVYQNVDAPADIQNRYISEDVPFILVPWYLLGKKMGYEASAMKSIIDISSIMHGVDYMKTGRTLDKMMLPTPQSKTVAWASSVDLDFPALAQSL